MDSNLVIGIISIIIGLVGIFLGIWIAGRLGGKLRTAVIFLIITVVIFIAKETLKTFNFFTTTNLELIRNIADIIIILLILLAVFSMRQMIDRIDNHYKKK